MSCKYCCSPYDNFGDDAILKIIKYGENYYLQHGTGYYDEYDNYDIESKIEFCPKCGANFIERRNRKWIYDNKKCKYKLDEQINTGIGSNVYKCCCVSNCGGICDNELLCKHYKIDNE